NERAGIAYRNSGIDTFKDGLFFATDLPPMKYLLSYFFMGGERHMLGTGEEDLFEVAPRQLYFWGAYQYQPVDSGVEKLLTGRGRYGLTPVSSPSEAQVLAMVRERVQSDRWKQRISARIAEIEQASSPKPARAKK